MAINHDKFDCLCGPQVIDMIMKKPGKITILMTYYSIIIISLTEFSFLIRYYNLLYQSLIPNCKLTIKILKQHLEISSDEENHILGGETLRVRCQRILNLLLVQLDSKPNHSNFSYLFNKISVLNSLPDEMIKTKGICIVTWFNYYLYVTFSLLIAMQNTN